MAERVLDVRAKGCNQLEFVETFHPVGQGLFYSGCIGGSFNFVYDCGSTSQAKKLKQAIVRYKKDVTKIHLLIISHFDKDHISGLDDLLANLELDSVVMPYVNILERILCILSSNLRSRWYRDFLVDPVEYLRSKGAKRIVFILPGDVGGADPSDTPDTGTNTDESIDLTTLRDDEQGWQMVRQQEPGWFEDGSPVLIKTHHGYISVRGRWRFRFLNLPVQDRRLTVLKQLLLSFNVDPSDRDSLVRAVKQPAKLKALKQVFKWAFTNDQNSTSLVCLHGSVDKPDALETHVDMQPLSEEPNRCFYGYRHVFTAGDLSFWEHRGIDEMMDPHIVYMSRKTMKKSAPC